MGTSKHVIILLTLALSGLLAAGQDKPAASAPAAQHQASNTRFASCIMRITVDRAIMLLDQGSVEGLLCSSGVIFKAGREVLSLNKPEDFARPLIKVEWLNASSAPMPAGARSSRQAGRGGPDEEMMRQMEQIYGRDYMQQMMGSSGEGKKDGAKEARPGESPQGDSTSDPSRQDRSDDDPMKKGRPATSGMAVGGAIGGMGGMGMGGGAFSAQEPSLNPSRLPGESEAAYRARLLQVRVQQKAGRSTGNRGVGMGAGMMAGYGGMGFYGVAGSPQQGEGLEQSATVKLTVDLPENLPPRADEFLRAVVRNLQGTLSRAHQSYLTEMERALGLAQAKYEYVTSELDGRASETAASGRIRQQLDTEVDLSQWSGQPPLATAIEILRKSVEPPLNIVVLWRDVQSNLSVDPATPVTIGGSPKIRLGTALDLLVKGLHDGSGTPMWRIEDDAIVIGTAATLGRSQGVAGQPRVETNVAILAGQESELARRMQALELDLAGIDARQQAIQEQIAATQAAAVKQLARDPVTRELEQLERTNAFNLENLKKAAEAGRVTAAELAQAEESGARIRIDLARRREELSRQAGGGQLEEFTKDLSHSAVDKAEKEAQLQMVRRQLEEVQKQLAQALTFDPEAARLRMAQESLDITARRIAELQMRIANLQPPTVLVIGAN